MSDPEAGGANRRQDDECVVPVPIAPAVTSGYLPDSAPYAREHICRYVEVETRGETVVHAELLKTEFIYGRRHDVWDVHTSDERYWVITNLTNLYSQKHFPSLDFTLTVHFGLMVRMQGAALNTRG
jgi:hypothetical protein